MSQPLRVAGFEVIISGRFWVITKEVALKSVLFPPCRYSNWFTLRMAGNWVFMEDRS
jgi:hypothetical protein